MAYLGQQKPVEGQKLPQFSILVCGKTGIGKSSLINFILGEDVCAVGDPVKFDVEPQTKDVQGHEVNMSGVQVTIFDSPGLQGGASNDEEYLADMYEKCRDVDLVFYCHDMLIARWTEHEVDTVRMLTEKFGATFWDRAIFVLTRANMLQPSKPMTEEEMRDYFHRSTGNNTNRFRNEVKKELEAMHPETKRHVDSIPVVPVGSDKVYMLPNGKHFIEDLWVNSSERVTDQYFSRILMQAAKQSTLKKEEHLFIGQNMLSITKWVVGGAIIGAVAGAAVIPLVGPAVGVGVGAAVGAGVGGISCLLKNRTCNKKE